MTPEQIANETVEAWKAQGKMPQMAWDFRGLAADAARKAISDQRHACAVICDVFAAELDREGEASSRVRNCAAMIRAQASTEQSSVSQLSEFEQGVLYSASVLVAMHDEPVAAATILREAGLMNADCSGLDDFDKNNLRKIQGEKGIALRGL